jgi:hypothetical protein
MPGSPLTSTFLSGRFLDPPTSAKCTQETATYKDSLPKSGQ